MGPDCLLPASTFISMAIEAPYQSRQTIDPENVATSVDQLCYRSCNVKFDKALILEDNKASNTMLTLTPHPGSKDLWYDSSQRGDSWVEDCYGLVRLEKPITEGKSRLYLFYVTR